MKYFVILLVLVGLVGTVFAENDELQPEQQEPEQQEPEQPAIPAKCGKGTTLQDGICIVNENDTNTSSSGKWGTVQSHDVLSPLKQFKSGLASADVVCKGNLIVVIKTSTGSPACVKPEHVERLLANGWFSVHPSDRAIRPLVTVIDNEKNLGIELTEMEITLKQNYGIPHENSLKVSAFQGNLSGIPTVVSKITNVSNQKIMLTQVLITGSIILSADSTMTLMYADVIGCSISHWEEGNVTCPYPTAVYEPIELEPDEYLVSYFSDDFAHKLGPINKITTSVGYDLESVDSPHYRIEIDSLLELEK